MVYISFHALYGFISPSAITLSVSVILINPTLEEINLGDRLLPTVIKTLLSGYNFCHRLHHKQISAPLWVLLSQNFTIYTTVYLHDHTIKPSANTG